MARLGSGRYMMSRPSPESEQCFDWMDKEQDSLEKIDFGNNKHSVDDSLKAIRHKVKVIDDYKGQISKITRKLKDENEKIAVETAYESLKFLAEKRLHCLEDMSQIGGLEEMFGALTAELADRATHLVTSYETETLKVPERNGERIPHCSQTCILAVRNTWNWITKLVRCTDVHVKHVAEYHQFFHDLAEYEHWLPADTRKLDDLMLTTGLKGNREDASRLLSELKMALTILLTWQGKTDAIFDRAKRVVPIHLRSRHLDQPRPVTALCSYKTNDIEIQEGEELILLDNTMQQSWLVRSLRSREAYIPSVICLIPPPHTEAVNAALRFRLKLLGLWTCHIKRIGKTLIYFLLLIFRDWNKQEEEVLKSLPDEQKEKLMQMCDVIENSLVKYWSGYPDFKTLQSRFSRLRTLLRSEGDPRYRNSEMGRALIVQVGVVEELLRRYKDMWSYWEAYKMMVETCRHSEMMLICSKWEELKFISLTELLKHWHSGFGDDTDLLHLSEQGMEEISEEQVSNMTEMANGKTLEGEIYNVERALETAEAEHISSAELEENKTFIITEFDDLIPLGNIDPTGESIFDRYLLAILQANPLVTGEADQMEVPASGEDPESRASGGDGRVTEDCELDGIARYVTMASTTRDTTVLPEDVPSEDRSKEAGKLNSRSADEWFEFDKNVENEFHYPDDVDSVDETSAMMLDGITGNRIMENIVQAFLKEDETNDECLDDEQPMRLEVAVRQENRFIEVEDADRDWSPAELEVASVHAEVTTAASTPEEYAVDARVSNTVTSRERTTELRHRRSSGEADHQNIDLFSGREVQTVGFGSNSDHKNVTAYHAKDKREKSEDDVAKKRDDIVSGHPVEGATCPREQRVESGDSSDIENQMLKLNHTYSGGHGLGAPVTEAIISAESSVEATKTADEIKIDEEGVTSGQEADAETCTEVRQQDAELSLNRSNSIGTTKLVSTKVKRSVSGDDERNDWSDDISRPSKELCPSSHAYGTSEERHIVMADGKVNTASRRQEKPFSFPLLTSKAKEQKTGVLQKHGRLTNVSERGHRNIRRYRYKLIMTTEIDFVVSSPPRFWRRFYAGFLPFWFLVLFLLICSSMMYDSMTEGDCMLQNSHRHSADFALSYHGHTPPV